MIKVLASGSNGNCYIIQAAQEKLIIEGGIRWEGILKGLGYSIQGVKGCLVSHKHGDHAMSIKKIIDRSIKVFAPIEVLEKYKLMGKFKRTSIVENEEIFHTGGFTVRGLSCHHTNVDGSECENLGYLIKHEAIGKILFATDTYFMGYKFKDIDHVMIECNYSEKYMYDLEAHEERVFRSHMSLETLKATLKTWDLSKTKTITLLHLSKNNSNPEEFKKEIQELTGVPTYIAKPGLTIE